MKSKLSNGKSEGFKSTMLKQEDGKSEKMEEKEKFVIKKSENKQFLWKVITPKQKEVYFGNPRVKNYTISKDTKEK